MALAIVRVLLDVLPAVGTRPAASGSRSREQESGKSGCPYTRSDRGKGNFSFSGRNCGHTRKKGPPESLEGLGKREARRGGCLPKSKPHRITQRLRIASDIQPLMSAGCGQAMCSETDSNRAFKPFHTIWAPIHASRKDQSFIITDIPVGPRTRARRSANP